MDDAAEPAGTGLAAPNPAQVSAALGLSLLHCPSCGGSLASDGSGVACVACHQPVATYDGIVDFVAGSSSTTLDDIDYDQKYSVGLAESLRLYRGIQEAAGPLWPRSLGDTVEIGCGTGGFSMAMLSQLPAANVVLTDVSMKMLGLCRARLGRMSDLRAETVTFATYSGLESCFRPAVFDTCFGTSVLHHVIDVPRLLRQIHLFLKPGGKAFFLEPNLRFHRALTATLADILATWTPDHHLSHPEISPLLNWMAEVHCNIVNTGEIDILAHREDKHLFVAEIFETMAEEAGFGVAAALVCGADPTGANTIQVYMEQCGAGAAAMAWLLTAWPAAQRPHFEPLGPQDRSPSYFLWLEKRAVKARGWRTEPEPPAVVAPAALPATQLYLTVALRRDEAGLEITADGWCLAGEAVKSVQFSVGDIRGRLPIWRPRLDLLTMPGRSEAYPPLHVLCSGIEGTVHLAGVSAVDEPVEVSVEVVAVDGRLLPGRRIVLMPDGDSAVIHI